MSTQYQPGGYSQTSDYEAASTRSAFIMKTYSHLLAAIAAFAFTSILMMKAGFSDKMLEMVSAYQYAWLGVLGGAVLVSWLATNMTEKAESKSAQYMGLGLYILIEAVLFSVMFAVCLRFFDSGSALILQAALITAIAFIALTGVVFVTRKDFSFMKSILMWGGIIAMIAIGASFIFGFQLGIFFSIAMVALAGGAILYDTSNILHHYREDQYVAASLSLFASVMLLFWYVLRIVMSLASDD